MSKLILLDFDGVIADSMPQILKNAEKACNSIGHTCWPSADIISQLEKMEFIEFGKKLDIPEDKLEDFVTITLKLLHEENEIPSIYSGMESVIRELAKENTLCIVTGNSSNIVSSFLDNFGLSNCFAYIYDVYHTGTKADKILEAIDKYGYNSDNAFMIGDAASDIAAAQKAGVTSIAVSWGHQAIERLKKLSPNIFVSSPQELLEVLQK